MTPIKELIAEILKQDNKTVHKVLEQLSFSMEKRETSLNKALKSKNKELLVSLKPFYDRLSHKQFSIIKTLNFEIKDADFIHTLLDYPISLDEKNRILDRYLSFAIKHNEFYASVKEVYREKLTKYLDNQFHTKSFSGVCIDVFKEYVEKNDIKFSLDNLRTYTKIENNDLLNYLLESEKYRKLFNFKSNNYKIITSAINHYNIDSVERLYDYYGLVKSADIVFYDDNNSQEFCRKSSPEFFNYFLKNFNFDHKELIYLFAYLPKVNSTDKWGSAIDCLVINHRDDEHYLEQISRRIESCKHEDFKNAARIHFNYHTLDNILEEKINNKRIKI